MANVDNDLGPAAHLEAPPPPPPTFSAPPAAEPAAPPSFSAPPPPPPPVAAAPPPPPPPPPPAATPAPPTAGGGQSFSAPPPPAGGYAPPPPPLGGGSRRGTLQPVPANLGGWLGEAWAALSSDWGGWLMIFVPYLIGIIAIMVISTLTAGIGGILGLAMGPLAVGTAAAILKKFRTGENTDVGGIFEFSMSALVPGIVYSIVLGIALSCGFTLCLVPGLFLLTPAMLGLFMLADGETDFIKPLMSNIEVAKADIGGYLIFGLVMMIISGFGITLPLVYMAFARAYQANYD